MCILTLAVMDRTTDRGNPSEDGWVLLSDSLNRHLPPTDKVHHRDGCNVNNGRNKLYEASPDALVGKIHCKRCEAILGSSYVGRPVEGVKIEVRLPSDILDQVDARANELGQTRAATLRELISGAL